jgi:hypothetical protein
MLYSAGRIVPAKPEERPMTHPLDNPRFKAFRKQLEEEQGVTLHALWEAKSTRNAPATTDLCLFQIVGGRGGTLIAMSYGEDGYAIWFDEATNKIQDDIERICG